MKVLPQQLRLYAVTDRTWLNGHRLADVVAQAIDGGATFVQLREKCLDEHDLLAEAEELSALCHFRHVPFVIDDNVEVALAAGADGVHVGQSDMAAKRARALLGRIRFWAYRPITLPKRWPPRPTARTTLAAARPL